MNMNMSSMMPYRMSKHVAAMSAMNKRMAMLSQRVSQRRNMMEKYCDDDMRKGCVVKRT